MQGGRGRREGTEGESFTSPDFFFKKISVMKCLRSKKRLNDADYTTVRRPDLTRMILDPQQEKVAASCSGSIGPAQCKQSQLISTMVRTRTEGGQYQWLILQRADKGV